MSRERSFRVYGEGPTPRCSSPLLEAWRRACLEEERAAAMGWPG